MHGADGITAGLSTWTTLKAKLHWSTATGGRDMVCGLAFPRAMVFLRTLVTSSAISALNRSISWHWLARAWWRISSATFSPCETNGKEQSAELDHCYQLVWSWKSYLKDICCKGSWRRHFAGRTPRATLSHSSKTPKQPTEARCRKSRIRPKFLMNIWQNLALFFL